MQTVPVDLLPPPVFSEWRCHSLNAASLVISQMLSLRGRAVGANVWGGPSRSLGTVCGLRHPAVLKWLHVASFFVLLKHTEMRTVPGVEAVGEEEGRGDG